MGLTDDGRFNISDAERFKSIITDINNGIAAINDPAGYAATTLRRLRKNPSLRLRRKGPMIILRTKANLRAVVEDFLVRGARSVKGLRQNPKSRKPAAPHEPGNIKLSAKDIFFMAIGMTEAARQNLSDPQKFAEAFFATRSEIAKFNTQDPKIQIELDDAELFKMMVFSSTAFDKPVTVAQDEPIFRQR